MDNIPFGLRVASAIFLSGVALMLCSLVTAFVDVYFFSNQQGRAVSETGHESKVAASSFQQSSYLATATERAAFRESNAQSLRTWLTGTPYGKVGRRARR